MKAIEANFLAFLKKSPQFQIPIYQRPYSWTPKQCIQLWEDILRTGRNDNIPSHFVGSIVYVEKDLYSVSSQSSLLVIDGQQRLTTITLIIEALSQFIGENEPIEGFSAKKLRNYYLLNSLEDGDKKYKLILSQTDKDSLLSVIEQRELPRDHSIRIFENFNFFKEAINSSKDELEVICKGVAKLVIVDISLSRGQDNPQLIFESLNSTGKELSQADLIRNYILMGLEPKIQTKLYEQYWRPMELDFGQVAYNEYFDSFMRHYLTIKTGSIPNIREVYEVFKMYAREAEGDIESLVADIRSYSKFFCFMALGSEPDDELKAAFHDLLELRVDVAYPFLLELYYDYSQKILSKSDFINVVQFIESYVFRRSVCAIPTNSMNKTFATFIKLVKKDKYLESIKARFLLLPSYRRFPSDDEFKKELQTKDLYNFRNRSYWLRRLENYDRKEHVSVDEYTIEHILPQNEKLPEPWKNMLGPDWKRVHQTWLHTLGNLTLTGYNAEYSDRPFIEKRDMKGGFKVSPIQLNASLRNAEKWDEEAIINRAKELSQMALNVWSIPMLDNNILETYKEIKEPVENYTIEDHPFLLSDPVKTLFNAFRKEVKALDPCVTETFLKLYVAYKAETNFVDVVPQSKRLRLSLNLSFHEVNDPRGVCKDVSGLGRWGNGDVEVMFSSIDELPYILGLVRQAFEKQISNGDSL